MVKTTYVIRDGKKYPLYDQNIWDEKLLVVPAIPNVSKYIARINQLKAELEAEKASRDNWKTKFENAEIKPADLPANWRTELARITDLEKRPDIPISKSDWENDWSKRPTLTDYNNLLANQKPNDLPDNWKELSNEITKLKGEKQQIIKERDNYKTQLTQKENQLEQTIKDFQEKEKTKHQEYLQLLTKKDKDWEKKLEQALKKPPTAEMGTQTDIKRGEIEKMEQSIFKYQEQITQEQNKVQQKETELASLEKEIKELTDKQKKDERTIQELQSKLPNEVEKKLASYFNLSVPELLKKDDELLMGEGKPDWSKLRGVFSFLRMQLSALITQLKRDQITQQELQEELTKLQTTKTEEENKAAKLEKEIQDLQEKMKDKELNEAEKELLSCVEKGISTPLAGTILPDELLKILQTENKWTSLCPEYEIVRTKLIFLTKMELERRDLQTKITELAQAKSQLQTQLDLATKSKEELLEYLKIYREMNVISFSSGSNSLAGNRFFPNLDDPQTTKVEKMENFEKFMKQHGNVHVVYLYLANNKLIELGNKNIFNSVRVWTNNVGSDYSKRNEKGQVWFKSNSNVQWKVDEIKIIGSDYRTNMTDQPILLNKISADKKFRFEFRW